MVTEMQIARTGMARKPVECASTLAHRTFLSKHTHLRQPNGRYVSAAIYALNEHPKGQKELDPLGERRSGNLRWGDEGRLSSARLVFLANTQPV